LHIKSSAISQQTHTESGLWQRARNGDRRAFEALYNLHAAALANQALRILRDREQAKDILQEVFISLYVKREELPDTLNVGGYLSNAVKYKVSNALRNKLVQESHHQIIVKEGYQPEIQPAVSLERNELKQQIDQSIHTLPQKCRQVFMLNYYGNLGYKAIAAELGISVKTVEKHMGKALQALRRELKAEHYVGIVVIGLMLN
jgi:RNA polymerase sigma-70 factor (ECF subfamily)